jgi:2,4-dienoyl-CoA reductase-like NADH-dependent reductase (Old Yellow Enzyme family)
MEGWDGSPDGNPSENTIRRWRRFGHSGAKLIWGGEAVAVSHEGRANPNQLVVAAHTQEGLSRLRATLIEEHRLTTGTDDGLLIGLQLTDSGRYSRPNAHGRPEPRILYHHPFLDRRLGLPADFPVLTDVEVEAIIESFHRAALMAWKLGFDFVDIKHCHGYLLHEFLSAFSRPGQYGGPFENRTRILREIVEAIRASGNKIDLAVRLSAFDFVPFKPDPTRAEPNKLGPGIPEQYPTPYPYSFGCNQNNPLEIDLTEPIKFVKLCADLGVKIVNLSAGSPYYNPHIQRPAAYPPSDGYQPPNVPLIDVARQINVVRQIKNSLGRDDRAASSSSPILIGTGYSYLQEFLPNVAQAAVREGWTDMVGIGRMVLSYPNIFADALDRQLLTPKLICRTFSDCTTAPRNGLPSGCYPLDKHYVAKPEAQTLKQIKKSA